MIRRLVVLCIISLLNLSLSSLKTRIDFSLENTNKIYFTNKYCFSLKFDHDSPKYDSLKFDETSNIEHLM